MLPYHIVLDVVATNLHTMFLIDNILIFFMWFYVFKSLTIKFCVRNKICMLRYFRGSRGDINWKIASSIHKTMKNLPVHYK